MPRLDTMGLRIVCQVNMARVSARDLLSVQYRLIACRNWGPRSLARRVGADGCLANYRIPICEPRTTSAKATSRQTSVITTPGMRGRNEGGGSEWWTRTPTFRVRL